MSPIQLKYRTGSYRIPIYASVESEIPFRSPGNVKEYLNKGKSKMSLQTCFLFCKPRHQGTQQSILEGSRARGGTGARANFHSAGGQTTNPRRKAERRYLRIEKRNQEAARAPGSRTPHLVHTRTKSPRRRAQNSEGSSRGLTSGGRGGRTLAPVSSASVWPLGCGSCSASSLSTRRVAVPCRSQGSRGGGRNTKAGCAGPGRRRGVRLVKEGVVKARYRRRQRVRRLPSEWAPHGVRHEHAVSFRDDEFRLEEIAKFSSKHFTSIPSGLTQSRNSFRIEKRGNKLADSSLNLGRD
jgi:hypothetical protein